MSIINSLINQSVNYPFTRLGKIKQLIAGCPEAKSILDLGCGDGQSLKLIANDFFYGIHITGIDADRKALAKALCTFVYNHLIEDNILTYDFGDKKYDIVLLCEVIEHLYKDDGHRLLDKLDDVAEKMIVITSPPHWDNDPNAVREEPIEDRMARSELWRIPHISVWHKEDYETHGYQTVGVNGLYFNSLPDTARYALGMLFSPIAKRFPDRANHIVAIKCFGGNKC